jgi:PHB de-polymerase C-terminus
MHCGTPQLQQWLATVSPTRNTAAHRMLVAMHGGILPGRYQLAGFKAMEPAAEFERVGLLLGNAHDKDDLAHYAKFADWFDHIQDISGAFYLWTVEHLFARNELVVGKNPGGRRAGRPQRDQVPDLHDRRRPRPHHSSRAGLVVGTIRLDRPEGYDPSSGICWTSGSVHGTSCVAGSLDACAG